VQRRHTHRQNLVDRFLTLIIVAKALPTRQGLLAHQTE
jgi:hypothetical protein